MRLGIFGGSFDPVHHGHLTLADCCARQAKLDQVWFVPAAQQPLKPSGPRASDADRLAMLKIALSDRPECMVSEVELQRGGVSYTVDTLATFRAQHPEAELFFLMGADALADMPHWRCPEEICTMATPLVVHRAGTPEPDFEVLANFLARDRLDVIRDSQVEMPGVAVSSSKVRALIAEQGDWQELVPANVAVYIAEHRLYRSGH